MSWPAIASSIPHFRRFSNRPPTLFDTRNSIPGAETLYEYTPPRPRIPTSLSQTALRFFPAPVDKYAGAPTPTLSAYLSTRSRSCFAPDPEQASQRRPDKSAMLSPKPRRRSRLLRSASPWICARKQRSDFTLPAAASSPPATARWIRLRPPHDLPPKYSQRRKTSVLWWQPNSGFGDRQRNYEGWGWLCFQNENGQDPLRPPAPSQEVARALRPRGRRRPGMSPSFRSITRGILVYGDHHLILSRGSIACRREVTGIWMSFLGGEVYMLTREE